MNSIYESDAYSVLDCVPSNGDLILDLKGLKHFWKIGAYTWVMKSKRCHIILGLSNEITAVFIKGGRCGYIVTHRGKMIT